MDREASQRASQQAQPAVASAKAPEASRLIDPGMINTDNLTLADLQKIHEMARSYIGLAMDKAEKVEQAQKMLAYLKSQLPSDKANQVFHVLAEKGIFNRNLLTSAGSVAGLGAGVVITIETLGSIALAPEIAIGALIAGGVYITYEVATYLIDKVRSTSGETAARDAEDTLYRKGNAGGRSMSAIAPRAGTHVPTAGGNPDPDDKCQKKVPKSGSGKEKADDVPSRFRGERPYIWESGADFAKRLLDAECGVGNYKTGTGSDFARLQKWGNRGFELPKCSKKSKK